MRHSFFACLTETFLLSQQGLHLLGGIVLNRSMRSIWTPHNLTSCRHYYQVAFSQPTWYPTKDSQTFSLTETTFVGEEDGWTITSSAYRQTLYVRNCYTSDTREL